MAMIEGNLDHHHDLRQAPRRGSARADHGAHRRHTFFQNQQGKDAQDRKKHCSQLLKMQSDEEWNCLYDNQAESLERAPYPSIEAIQNVFALAVKRDPEIKEFNPLILWDLHYVKEIDDSGYVRRLYA
jgi:hypothetical protein